jgi:hypothetical protein
MSPLTAGPRPVPPRAEDGETPPSRFDDHLAAQLLAQRIVVLGTQVDEVSANRVGCVSPSSARGASVVSGVIGSPAFRR